MKRLLVAFAIGLALSPATAYAVSSPGGGRVTTTSSYTRPPVGSTVVVTKATTARPAVTAKVPPVQTAGSPVSPSKTLTTAGTPYSPSGYGMPSGRPAIYSPVTRTYVEVHHYWYSDWPIYSGYYGCLYCWSGPYAYAPVPVPFTPANWSQPSWSYDLEAVLFLLLIVFGLVWLGRVWGRRSYY